MSLLLRALTPQARVLRDLIAHQLLLIGIRASVAAEHWIVTMLAITPAAEQVLNAATLAAAIVAVMQSFRNESPSGRRPTRRAARPPRKPKDGATPPLRAKRAGTSR